MTFRAKAIGTIKSCGSCNEAKVEQVTRGKGLVEPRVADAIQYWQPLSHRRLLSTYNVVSVTKELNFKKLTLI